MKRIFLIAFILCIVMATMLPCSAIEVHTEAAAVTDAIDVGEGDFSTDWLTDLWETIKEHKSDIMTLALLIVAAIFEIAWKHFSKKVLPIILQALEKVKEMATAAGKITQTNKEQFSEVIGEMKGILAAGGDREKVLLDALAISEKNKEEYKAMCEQHAVQNQIMVTALMAQEQMIYETLMSAKLTDARKEELEKQHLYLKGKYEAIAIVKETENEDMEA